MFWSLACMDYRVHEQADVRPEREADVSEGDEIAMDTGDTGEAGEALDTGEPSSGSPRLPDPGSVVVNELMIDPNAVEDSLGEWVELLNTSEDHLDLNGAWIGDDDLDYVQLTALRDLVVAPGDAIVVCVSATDNGGVDCDATVPYDTFGDGFAMSNTRDEVVIYNPDGEMLDRVSWDEGFAPTGRSAALDPGHASTTDNDDAAAWCDQAASPGSDNSPC